MMVLMSTRAEPRTQRNAAGGQGDGAPLERFTGYLLRRAFVVWRQSAEACVGEDSTVREVPVLALVDGAGTASQRALGEQLGLNRTSISLLVDALEKKGWLERTRDDKDRRAYAVRISDAGRRQLAVLRRALDEGELQLTGRLTTSQRERLATLLRALLVGDATVDVPGLGSRCGYLIARAHRLMVRRAEDELAPLGISPRDFGVLTLVAAEQPCSQQRLASLLGVSGPAMLGFVEGLEERGLLARQRNREDRRAYDVTLTDHGAQVLRQATELATSIHTALAGSLGLAAVAELNTLLRLVIGQ